MQYQTIKAGDIIVSAPYSENGLIFHKSVILIISHTKAGTSGVIVNKLISNVNSSIILKALDIKPVKGIVFSDNFPVHFGGPIEPERGIIIHDSEYKGEPVLKVTNNISISTDSKIITDILCEKGPRHKIMILGYVSWNPGQLMDEIKQDAWVVLPDKEEEELPLNFKMVFLEDNIYKWTEALKKSGITLSNYAIASGNA